MLESEIERFVFAERLERSMAENTCLSYESDLKFFSEYLSRKGVSGASAISRDDIVGFLNAEREGGLSPATRRRRAAAIRMFLRFLKERRIISADPSELMDSPKKERILPKTLSEEEVFSMIDAVDGKDPVSLRDRAMLEFLYGCGLRVSELCGLKPEDIVADGELLRIVGKGSKERLVPIGAAAGSAVESYVSAARPAFAKGRVGEPHLFLTRLGGMFTRQGVFKMIKERAAKVGIAAERISPHVLRHCFASHMLMHGADIRAIQELLGHADVGTTQIYTHVDSARFSEIHRKCHPRG